MKFTISLDTEEKGALLQLDYAVEILSMWRDYLQKAEYALATISRDDVVKEVIESDEAATSFGQANRDSLVTPAVVKLVKTGEQLAGLKEPAAIVGRTFTAEEVVDATRVLLDKKGFPAASALLQEFGAKNATAVPPERRAEYIGKAEALANG